MDIRGQKRTDDLLTLQEVAEYLRVAEKTVLRMARRGEIPSAKVGGQWRFRKRRIDAWLDEQERGADGSDPLALLRFEGETGVPLSRLLRPEFVLIGLQPQDTGRMIQRLADPLVDAGILKDRQDYVDRVLARERVASTEVTTGVAVPHARNTESNPPGSPGVVAATCPDGTSFGNATNTVHLFFLLCAEGDVPHIRLLQLVSRLVRVSGAVEHLTAATTGEGFIERVVALEAAAAKGAESWN